MGVKRTQPTAWVKDVNVPDAVCSKVPSVLLTARDLERMNDGGFGLDRDENHTMRTTLRMRIAKQIEAGKDECEQGTHMSLGQGSLAKSGAKWVDGGVCFLMSPGNTRKLDIEKECGACMVFPSLTDRRSRLTVWNITASNIWSTPAQPCGEQGFPESITLESVGRKFTS